jgi:Acetyltransferase (GNAT) domain
MRPSQRRLSPKVSATGTHRVNLGVGATVLRRDTRFMVRLRPWKAFWRVNPTMSTCASFQGFLPLQQSGVYADAVSACGAHVQEICTGPSKVLVVERGRVRLISRGPVWDQPLTQKEKLSVMRGLARWPGVTIATPEEEVAGFGMVPLVTPVRQALWRLGPDLRAGMTVKWRNRLHVAEKAGILVEQGDRLTYARLIAEERRQRQVRGYRSLPEAFSRALPDNALRVWRWEQRGAIEAAMAFVVHGSTATYHLGWGSDAARANRVHGVMLTRAAEALSAEGVRWLDLGTVDSERASGLARFKLGTGARLRRLGSTCLVLP